MPANTGNPYNAAIDSNKNASLTAVTGTVGTADTGGTAEQIRVSANPATGALYVQDLSGASGTTNVTGTVVVCSISNVGQVHNAGTLATGANNIGDVDIATGTVTLVS